MVPGGSERREREERERRGGEREWRAEEGEERERREGKKTVEREINLSATESSLGRGILRRGAARATGRCTETREPSIDGVEIHDGSRTIARDADRGRRRTLGRIRRTGSWTPRAMSRRSSDTRVSAALSLPRRAAARLPRGPEARGAMAKGGKKQLSSATLGRLGNATCSREARARACGDAGSRDAIARARAPRRRRRNAIARGGSDAKSRRFARAGGVPARAGAIIISRA